MSCQALGLLLLQCCAVHHATCWQRPSTYLRSRSDK